MTRALRRRYGRAASSDRARLESLRATYTTKRAAFDDYERELRAKYGSNFQPVWLSVGQKTKREKLRAAYDKVGDKIVDLLVKVSPRGEAWLSGAPAWWIRERLTWEDATRPTGEPLSVEVPAPWGAREGLK